MPFRASKDKVILDGVSLNEGASASVASAATIDIWSGTGNLVPITGTASISAFTAAPQAGAKRTLLCLSTPTFVHGANFLLPGGIDHTVTAGDKIEVVAVTTTQFRLFTAINWNIDGSGNVAGLIGPDGTNASSLVGHAAEHAAMGGVGGSLGEFATVGALETAYPAVSNSGSTALVGSTAPYTPYVSNGEDWVEDLAADDSGNVRANVVPRTGTLASLLALAGANGEIAAATDIQALVVQAALGTFALKELKFASGVFDENLLGNGLTAPVTPATFSISGLTFAPKAMLFFASAYPSVDDGIPECACFCIATPGASVYPGFIIINTKGTITNASPGYFLGDTTFMHNISGEATAWNADGVTISHYADVTTDYSLSWFAIG